MPTQVGMTRNSGSGEALLIVQQQPEPLSVLKVLRTIKQQFPQEFRQVNYEIITPTGAALQTPQQQVADDEAAKIDDPPAVLPLKVFTGDDDENGAA